MNFKELTDMFAGVSEAHRPIQVRLWHANRVLDDVLLVKRVTGSETLCGGLEYQLLCVSTHADLPLKELVALPVELRFVTDQGGLRVVCGIVAQAAAGQSDGGLATYQLIVRDALALMELRTNTRIFRNRNELDIRFSWKSGSLRLNLIPTREAEPSSGRVGISTECSIFTELLQIPIILTVMRITARTLGGKALAKSYGKSTKTAPTPPDGTTGESLATTDKVRWSLSLGVAPARKKCRRYTPLSFHPRRQAIRRFLPDQRITS